MAIQSPEWQARIAKLVASDVWRHLRSQQKQWVLDFIETADESHAARAAYPKASEKSLLVMRYEIRRAKHIRAALAVWNASGASTQEDFDRLYAENQKLKADLDRICKVGMPVVERTLADNAPILMNRELAALWRDLDVKLEVANAN